MGRPYTLELKTHFVEATKKSDSNLKSLAKLFQISYRSALRWVSADRLGQSLQPKEGYQKGHSHRFKDLEDFKEEVDRNPNRTSAEIASDLGHVSSSVVRKMLRKIDYSRKKKAFTYSESNQEAKLEFVKELSELDHNTIVYLDESGIDPRLNYDYAWSKKGVKISDLKKGAREKRINIIAALCQSKLFAPFFFEGPCDVTVFNTYVDSILVPSLRPGSTVILDNASFHKASNIVERLAKKSCFVRFLPPYSPDLNKIENFWYSIKVAYKKVRRDLTINSHEAIEKVLKTLTQKCQA
jgi:transposase